MATLVKQFNIEANHSVPPVPQTDGWTSWQRILFRFSFLFLAQITLPLRLGWYERLLAVRSLRQVYSLSMRLGVTYTTIPGESGRWGIGSFASLGIAFVIAAVGAAIWTWFARKSPRTEYRALYYWLRLAVRYWVALNIMHYGYIKFLPMQMPYPSISNLHSLFGEHAPYRLYWQAVGIVTWYQIALGVMEVTAGSLLLFRSTTALGALLNLVILYNVAHGNFAYDGGVHLLSSEIALLSGFLLAQYIPDLWKLLIKREDVQPSYYRPVFKRKWQRYAFTGAKVLAWLLFIPGFVYETYHGFYYTNLSKEPRSPGLTASKGYYNVTEFRLNGKLLPYSPLDPVRWHDVVF
ncbi:MAG TPA: hypothetical protein VG892_00200, partial [Terriglobales bacterium]|nr:hypothetical protein [Terriglobales bacterium]